MASPSGSSLPSTYKAWRMKSAVAGMKNVGDLLAVRQSLILEENLPLPTLKAGQVLVKVACCTINDEDRYHLAGEYVNTKDVIIPRAMGFEGSGIVVASKAPWYLPGSPKVGTRVAFYANRAGAMGEYLVIDDPSSLTAIPPQVSYSNAAAGLMNPFTVILMVEKVKRAGYKVVVNTVPAGALGRLFTKYATTIGMDVIAIVRREGQKEICLQDGAKHILNMTDDNFEDQLQKLLETTNCHFAYDGLGGEMPNRLLKALPNDSVVSVYSHIVSQSSTVNVLNLFGNKRLESFNAVHEAKTLWFFQLLGLVSKIQKWMAQPEMATKVRQTYPLSSLPEAFVDSATGSKTAGKVQIVMNSSLLSTAEK